MKLESENKTFTKAMEMLKENIVNQPDPEPAFTESLEWDMAHLRNKLEDKDYAAKVYDALCNNDWQHVETKDIFHCSWRYAGSIVANNRKYNQDYLDYYCSGNEGVVDPEVALDFAKLGWILFNESPDVSAENKQLLEEAADLITDINGGKNGDHI